MSSKNSWNWSCEKISIIWMHSSNQNSIVRTEINSEKLPRKICLGIRMEYLWLSIHEFQQLNRLQRTCPHCLQEIITNPRKKTGRYQQCLSFILCCLILPFCCFWIPLTKDEMNDTIHYCPSCQMVIGIYRYDENNATCMGPMNRYDYFEWNFPCLLLF